MAGYTSRILLSLTVPSLFGFLSVLWFLKKKRTNSDKIPLNKTEKSSNTSSDNNQYQVATPMKLKEQISQSEGEHIQVSSSEMQLKETPIVVEKPITNGTTTQSPKVKGKKSKSKVRENRITCPQKEATTNDCKDKMPAEDMSQNLTNGVAALSLATEDSRQNGAVSPSSDASVSTMSSDDSVVTQKVKPLYSCHFKTQASPPKVSMTTDNSSQQPTVTKEDSVSEPVTEQCDSESRNCEVTPEVCATVTDTEVINAHQPLTLPIDKHSTVIVPSHEDMLESPGAKYCDSVGSNDSGKGGSEFQFILEQNTYYVVYEFEILGDLCGLLIGKKGSHVKLIKEKTNANILIKRHPYFEELKICSVTGAEDEIHAALKLLRNRFPIEKYPSVTLSQINTLPLEFQLPESLKLCLPEAVSFESMLCATVNAGHFFLQQPTHPTFHSLPALTSQMTALYSQLDTPVLTHLDKGYVCVAGLTSGWFRAEVDEVLENTDECRLKFLDYGGYSVVPRSSLRQIRYDFMNVPFQATECYLGSVTLLEGETSWSPEATAVFEELAQGQIVQGYIIGYAENRVPYVHLHKITGATTEFINRELVRRGVARWVDGPH